MCSTSISPLDACIHSSLSLREAYLCRRGLWDISAEQGAAERPQHERSYMARWWHCFGVCHALGWHGRWGKRAAENPAGATSCTSALTGSLWLNAVWVCVLEQLFAPSAGEMVSGLVSSTCPIQPLLLLTIHGCVTTKLHLLSSEDASLLNSMAFILSFCATVTRNMCNIEGAVNISLQPHQGHTASSYSIQKRVRHTLKGSFSLPSGVRKYYQCSNCSGRTESIPNSENNPMVTMATE